MHVITENNRSIGQVVAELKSDARDFVSTRLQMLIQEMNDKVKVWKVAVPLLAIAGLVGAVAFFTLTFAIVAFFAGVFQPSHYEWCYESVVVYVLFVFDD